MGKDRARIGGEGRGGRTESGWWIGRQKDTEEKLRSRKGMMYDLSVPRSAVARFSTPSSFRT